MTPEELKKQKKKEYWEEYYKKNREILLEKQKIRSKKNYQESKDKYKKRSKEWREKNYEKYKELTKKWSLENKEKVIQKSRDWYKNNKEKAKKQNRKRKIESYGITIQQYETMLEKQNHQCAICGKKNNPDSKMKLRIDHCHSTGNVRGLICNQCNTGLGSFKDNTELLKKAIDYLVKTPLLFDFIEEQLNEDNAA